MKHWMKEVIYWGMIITIMGTFGFVMYHTHSNDQEYQKRCQEACAPDVVQLCNDSGEVVCAQPKSFYTKKLAK